MKAIDHVLATLRDLDHRDVRFEQASARDSLLVRLGMLDLLLQAAQREGDQDEEALLNNEITEVESKLGIGH